MKKAAIACLIISAGAFLFFIIILISVFVNLEPLLTSPFPIRVSGEHFSGEFCVETESFRNDIIHINHENFRGWFNVENMVPSDVFGNMVPFGNPAAMGALIMEMEEIAEAAKAEGRRQIEEVIPERIATARRERNTRMIYIGIIGGVFLLAGALLFLLARRAPAIQKAPAEIPAANIQEPKADANSPWACRGCGYVNENTRRSCKSCDKAK